ncbi:MAG: hypothetical protein AAGI52_06695 [Bacteroidota bacterium]
MTDTSTDLLRTAGDAFVDALTDAANGIKDGLHDVIREAEANRERADSAEAEVERLVAEVQRLRTELDGHECPDEPPSEPPSQTDLEAPMLPLGVEWTRASTLAAAEHVRHTSAVSVKGLPNGPEAGALATFQDGRLVGIVGAFEDADLLPGSGAVVEATLGRYVVTGDEAVPGSGIGPYGEKPEIRDEYQHQLDAKSDWNPWVPLRWPLVVYRADDRVPVGVMEYGTGRIEIEDPKATDGETLDGVATREGFVGEDQTDRLAALDLEAREAGSILAVLYDVPMVGRVPEHAWVHVPRGEDGTYLGCIVAPPADWEVTRPLPGASKIGETLPEAPHDGHVVVIGPLATFDWSDVAQPPQGDHHGVAVRPCVGYRYGIQDVRLAIEDAGYIDGDPVYGPAQEFKVETDADGLRSRFEGGPVDEGRRRFSREGEDRLVILTPDGELDVGPIYKRFENWMPITADGVRDESEIIGWASIWGEIEWADEDRKPRPCPEHWRVPGALTVVGRPADCLAARGLRGGTTIGAMCGRGGFIATGGRDCKPRQDSSPDDRAIVFRCGLLDPIVQSGYTNSPEQGSSRRGGVKDRSGNDYGYSLNVGSMTPAWKEHNEKGADLSGATDSVTDNRWDVVVLSFDDKAGAISSDHVSCTARLHSDRSGASGFSIADNSRSVVVVSGEGEGEPFEWRGERLPWRDASASKSASGVSLTLAPGAFATLDSRAAVSVFGEGQTFVLDKGKG